MCRRRRRRRCASRSVPIIFMFNRCSDRIKIHVCCGSIGICVSGRNVPADDDCHGDSVSVLCAFSPPNEGARDQRIVW